MLDRGLTVFDLAKRVGVHPLEVAAILGREVRLPKVLLFGEDDVAAVERTAPIERWWNEPPSVDDPSPARARFRSVLARLLAAASMVRLDNAFRGLSEADARTLHSAIDELVELDVLRQQDTLRGDMIGVADRPRAEAMRDGNDIPERVRALW